MSPENVNFFSNSRANMSKVLREKTKCIIIVNVKSEKLAGKPVKDHEMRAEETCRQKSCLAIIYDKAVLG